MSNRDEACQGEQTNNSLDLTIKNWHATEMQLAKARDALTALLRLQTGVSPQAKKIIRAALTS